jgi:MFS family permease
MAESRTPQQRNVVSVYVGTSAMYTLATSIIWGVNTLFLLHAGLDIFQVMLVNTTFTIGQIVFEIPTGVVADTIGRKASLLLGVATLFVSTLLYVAAAQMGGNLAVFIVASVLIGLGFTFQTGATDAWLVDALDHVEWDGGKEQVFAWGGMTFGVAMLFGTIIGGVLGQIDLSFPYYARSAILVLCFAAIAVFMKDMGFEPRALAVSSFGEETRKILAAGVQYGWRNKVVRPLLFVSLLQGVFFLYAFYSSQPYFLDLLQRNLVWVAAAVTAGVSIMSIVGNALVKPIMAGPNGRRRAALVLAALTGMQGVLAVGIATVGLVVPQGAHGLAAFSIAVAMWLVFGVIMGVTGPVRQSFLNEQIPSAQRATVLSVDAFFADVGGSAGQPALGYVAKVASIQVGWLIGAVALLVSGPLYDLADRADEHRSSGS